MIDKDSEMAGKVLAWKIEQYNDGWREISEVITELEGVIDNIGRNGNNPRLDMLNVLFEVTERVLMKFSSRNKGETTKESAVRKLIEALHEFQEEVGL